MLSREQAAARVAAIRDNEWLASLGERLRGVPDEQREIVACAINPDRRQKLIAKGDVKLPELLQSEFVRHERIEHAGGGYLIRLSQEQRRVILEELVPGRVDVIETGLSTLARKPLRVSYHRLPFRVSRGERLAAMQAEWLCDVLLALGPLRAPLPELAGWLPHLAEFGDVWPRLMAAVIDRGGDEGEQTLQALLACVRGEHETGEISEQVIRSLLCCSRLEAWECVEKLLLAAQRQEGLRQSILEYVHEAHPEAFKRMCRVIIDQRLCRFSSVVRAADVWLWMLWDSASAKVVEEAIEHALYYLDNPDERLKAVKGKDPVRAYFALWAAGFEDLETLLELAPVAQVNKESLVRFAAVCVLARLPLPEVGPLLVKALDDPDLRVAGWASRYFQGQWSEVCELPETTRATAFDALERLLERLPTRTVALEPAIWPWTGQKLKEADIAAGLLAQSSEVSNPRLLKHLARMNSSCRASIALHLGYYLHSASTRPEPRLRWQSSEMPEAHRQVLVGLLADMTYAVVDQAAKSLHGQPIQRDEEAALAKLLSRKRAEFRTVGLQRAAQMTDARLLEFASSLLATRSPEQRLAGLELLRTMIGAQRSAELARRAIAAWAEKSPALTKQEQAALEELAGSPPDYPRRDDAFGLINPERLAKPSLVRPLPMLRMSDAAWKVLASLAKLILDNRELEIPPEPDRSAGAEPVFLSGERFWNAASPQRGYSRDQERRRCPITHLIDAWLEERSLKTRDEDGFELLRAYLGAQLYASYIFGIHGRQFNWKKEALQAARREGVRIQSVTDASLRYVLEWILKLDGDRGYARALLDSLEGAVAAGAISAVGSRIYEALGADEPAAVLARSMGEWTAHFKQLVRSGVIEATPLHRVHIWRMAVNARPLASEFWSAKVQVSGPPSYFQLYAAQLAVDVSPEVLVDAVAEGAASEDDVLDFATHSYWGREQGHVPISVNLIFRDFAAVAAACGLGQAVDDVAPALDGF